MTGAVKIALCLLLTATGHIQAETARGKENLDAVKCGDHFHVVAVQEAQK
ncbi:hypothetical protein [uncultured Dubosiella sp.]